MRLLELKTVLETSGMRVAFQAFPETDVPDMPFLTYSTPFTNNAFADDVVYKKINHVYVTLWTDKKDEAAELAVENALVEAGVPWEYSQDYNDDEKCYETIYELEV